MCDTQPDDFPLLAGLVGDVDRFATEHWGRRPCHVVHADLAVTSVPAMSIADVEAMLDSAPRSPTIRLVQDGRTRAASEWTSRLRLGGVDLDDVADPRKVAAAFRDGASLVLQGLHRTWAPMIAYGRMLQQELSHPVQVNAYLTPPGARGLARHTDAHDVFVVQTSGSKHWWVDGLGDLTLTPGDVIHIPVGASHGAESLDDVSLHVTIGVLRRTVHHAVERALRDVRALDRPLPLGFARDEQSLARAVEGGLREAGAALFDAARDVGGLVDAIGGAGGGRSASRGGLQAVADAAALDLGSELAWRMESSIEFRETAAIVRTGDRWLELPTEVVAAIGALRDGDVHIVGELPGLDDDSRLVLARRLVREGIVGVVPDRSSGRIASAQASDATLTGAVLAGAAVSGAGSSGSRT